MNFYRKLFLILLFISNAQAATLDEMIGQMLVIGFKGFDLQENTGLLDDIQNKRIGGVVLYDFDHQKLIHAAKKQKVSLPYFKDRLKDNKEKLTEFDRNIKNPTQLRKLNKDLRDFSLKYIKLPLIIAIDMEGGKVDRLSFMDDFPKTISQKAFADLPEKQARNLAKRYAATLKESGVNFVFAPVVDLAINPSNPVIAKLDRAFSDNPKIVTKYSNYLIDIYTKKHIACSLKYFPGYGSSSDDSYLGFVDTTNTWVSKELEPYRNILLDRDSIGITVMIGHIINKNFDKKGLPASLSKDTINVLKENYNFKGIVISDDLQMKSITDNFTLEDTLKLAILSGNDLLLFSNQVQYEPHIAKKAIAIIKKLIKKNVIPEDRIVDSYQKILKFKKWIG